MWQFTPHELTCIIQFELLDNKGIRESLNLIILYYATPNVASSAWLSASRVIETDILHYHK